jgi:hypothetical protein
MCSMLVQQGCSPPVKQLTAYRGAFDSARASTEEFILAAKNDVNAVANSPHNREAAKESSRRKQLDALDQRLHALDAVTSFNNALVALCTNSDPAEIQGQLKTFTGSITKLIPSISGMAGPLGAATGAVAEGVALIESAMRLQKFGQIVAQADKVVPPLFDYLTGDVRCMFEARWALTLDEYADAKADFLIASLRARKVLHAYADAPKVRNYFTQLNDLRATAALAPANPFVDNAPVEPPLTEWRHDPATGASPWAEDSTDDLAAGAFVSEAKNAQERMAAAVQKLTTLQELEAKYRDQMDAARSAFQDLVFAAQNPSVDLASSTDTLATTVREFRQAYLAFKEAK